MKKKWFEMMSAALVTDILMFNALCLFQVTESKFRYDSGNITPTGRNLPK